MNRNIFEIVFGVVLVLTLAAVAPPARADAWTQATRFTFSQAVEVPGNVVLPAGSYWFVYPGSAAGARPDIVHIFNADRTRLVATVQAIPALRTSGISRTELRAAKQGLNRPDALREWFYPGFSSGHEFLYSPRRETTLSADSQVNLRVRNAS